MSTEVSIPTSHTERLELGPEALRFPATFEEFVGLLEKAEYPVEYERGEIIIMSIATDEHERIVANLLGALYVELRDKPGYGRYGSNRHIYIPELQKAYAPDASVVRGQPSSYEYAKGKNAYTNPWLVAEVISPSSRNRDFGEKLQGYKSIPGLDHILYIEQAQPFVTLFERIPDTYRWKSTDYDDGEQLLEMGVVRFRVGDLYVQV
ncbi:MAG: Uma2 family endonuclease [Phaeodactylibacter xiamenensis]|jgi:Uma2 family endonuclease|uniref:Uma2 family endonuclease n=1 Tax=Phaeodactylibacter xiamenensis TaxID=1524460 RepID=UPI000696FC27|nr:Uma2 family endonuclease [Phaeodactylibacter xiamenensis]MCR9051415.1 Uma2 family endonuclease [bacterium]